MNFDPHVERELMAAVVDQFEFKRLVLKATPRVGTAEESKENSFWRKFKFPIVSKEAGAVTNIHFSPAEPHDFAVTAGSKVQVYSSVTNEVRKSLSRFQEVAYSGHFRHDGQLLVAGSEGGVVKVFDSGSRAILRQFKGHAKAVKTVHFSPDGLRVLSGSDDTSVRSWDLATGACLTTLRGHEDYVRRVVCIPGSSDLVLSGSYDHTLRLWDLRTGTGVWECDHGHPVETLLVFPSGGMGVSGGGNVVQVWDILRGRSRPLVSVCNHQKTVTCLAFDGGCRRLLSAGLDKQLKVYSVEDYRVIHSMSYPAPVLSLAMSPTDSHLVVGMTNRLLSIKQRPAVRSSGEDDAEMAAALLPSAPRPGTHRYFVRGKHYQPQGDEYFVAQTKKQHVPQHERFLRKFEYREALNSVLKVNWRGKNNPRRLVVYSLLQELARRDGLSIALSGRNEKELYPILLFTRFSILEPKYSSFMLDVFDMILDIYGETLYQSKSIAALLRLVKGKIAREMEFQRRGFQLLGAIDALLTAAMATNRHTPSSTVIPHNGYHGNKTTADSVSGIS